MGDPLAVLFGEEIALWHRDLEASNLAAAFEDGRAVLCRELQCRYGFSIAVIQGDDNLALTVAECVDDRNLAPGKREAVCRQFKW